MNSHLPKFKFYFRGRGFVVLLYTEFVPTFWDYNALLLDKQLFEEMCFTNISPCITLYTLLTIIGNKKNLRLRMCIVNTANS